VQLPGVTHDRPSSSNTPLSRVPVEDFAVHDVNIGILRDVALIHGRSTYTVLADGADQEALYTDTYQKRDGTWVRVAACAIAPGGGPPKLDRYSCCGILSRWPTSTTDTRRSSSPKMTC
jgi:hypothetical protein